jgi:hypothetical protein
MSTICGIDCCSKCTIKGSSCDGCTETDGHPCGGRCVAAECIKTGGFDAFYSCKSKIVEEINSLGIRNLRVSDMNLLNGFYVNMEYMLPNGQHAKLLDDKNVYWCNQVEILGSDRCYGIAADESYLLICQYGCDGSDPEIILYRKR